MNVIRIKDGATPEINRVIRSTAGRGILAAMGTAVKVGVQDHLLARPSNKRGWPTTNFYKRAARATSSHVQGDTATVSVNHLGIAQRYYGGDIEPQKATFLTLPDRAEAYGHRAREFPFLTFGFAQNRFGKMQPALIEARRTEIKIGNARKDGTRKISPTQTILGGGVWYWLTRHVHQDPDPDVLPTEDQTAQMAQDAGAAFIERQNRREAN